MRRPGDATYTFVTLGLSQTAYDEIATKLRAAGYDQAFTREDAHDVIDMHGLAVTLNTSADAPEET